MIEVNAAQRYRLMAALAALHITIIAASNYLVQIPFTLFGFDTTWGAFTYPFIFIATDLTVRLFGAGLARRILFVVMFPALAVSYLLSVLFVDGEFAGWAALGGVDGMAARVVLASFTAYLLGQLLDITVFRRLLRLRFWWIAPTASAILGTFLDTLVFFSIAFAGSSNAFMATHWPQLAVADYGFKLLFSLGLFVPLYGVLLKWLQARLLWLTDTNARPSGGAVQSR
jgi:uncharacterized integral membrane protein (TIGR00697 family)